MKNQEYHAFMERMWDLENSVRKELLFRYADKFDDTATPDDMMEILSSVCAEIAENNSATSAEAFVIQNYLIGSLSVQCMKLFMTI